MSKCIASARELASFLWPRPLFPHLVLLNPSSPVHRHHTPAVDSGRAPRETAQLFIATGAKCPLLVILYGVYLSSRQPTPANGCQWQRTGNRETHHGTRKQCAPFWVFTSTHPYSIRPNSAANGHQRKRSRSTTMAPLLVNSYVHDNCIAHNQGVSMYRHYEKETF